mgnify:CR=1 FL=1
MVTKFKIKTRGGRVEIKLVNILDIIPLITLEVISNNSLRDICHCSIIMAISLRELTLLGKILLLSKDKEIIKYNDQNNKSNRRRKILGVVTNLCQMVDFIQRLTFLR